MNQSTHNNSKPIKISHTEALEWDVYNWKSALKYWQALLPSSLDGKRVLEIGARDGGLTAWLASLGADVVSSDVSELSDRANNLFEKYNLKSKINYEKIDATNIPYENAFDIVIFKSVAGGIGSFDRKDLQSKLFIEIKKSLKPNGLLLFAENLSASPIHQWVRKRFNKWGGRWRYPQVNEMREFLKNAGFKEYTIHTNGFSGAFGRNEKQRSLLGRLDKYFFTPLVPQQWHYICYGSAKKQELS